MKEIILKVLEEVANSQINLQSESARTMIADKLTDKLNLHIQHLMEEVICPSNVPAKE